MTLVVFINVSLFKFCYLKLFFFTLIFSPFCLIFLNFHCVCVCVFFRENPKLNNPCKKGEPMFPVKDNVQ